MFALECSSLNKIGNTVLKIVNSHFKKQEMELLFMTSLLFTIFILQVNAVGSADVRNKKRLVSKSIQSWLEEIKIFRRMLL